MRTVVIPDIHQKIDWVGRILSREGTADEFIFLGDWFDSWEGAPGAASFAETCQFLRGLATSHPASSRFIFLVGNHDMPYIYHNSSSSRSAVKRGEEYQCSGFSRSKARAFRKVFYESGLRDNFFVSRFAPIHQSQGITISHAGLHDHHLLPGESPAQLIANRLPQVWSNFRNCHYPGNALLSGCGRSRGGEDLVGGVLWLDWNLEFTPSVRIGRQLVGHTHSPEPRGRALGTSCESWNLDTGVDYAVVIDGLITTRRLP